MMRDSWAEGVAGCMFFLVWGLLTLVPTFLVGWVALHFILKFW